MCGRFSTSQYPDKIIKFLEAHVDIEFTPRYNIAPSQSVPILRKTDDDYELIAARWGLIAGSTKVLKPSFTPINARGETVASKWPFKEPFKTKRCLIPVTGFYEWKRDGDKKQPYNIGMKDKSPFAMAGIWDRWNDGEKDIDSFAIITTSANSLMKPIHHRMPVIVNENDYKPWLDLSIDDILKPFPDEPMAAFKISDKVNNARNITADIIEPI